MTARTNWHDGLEVSTFDMTHTSLTAVAGQLKARTNDFFSFGVVTGLTVMLDSQHSNKLLVIAGTAYDPTGERIYVPANVSSVDYNGTNINVNAGSYTLVARYLEINDGVTSLNPDATVAYNHILDYYSLNVLKTGTDSLGVNDVRLGGVKITAPGSTFIIDQTVRDNAANRLGGGSTVITSGGGGGGGGAPAAHAGTHLQNGTDPILPPVTIQTGAGGVVLTSANYYLIVNKVTPDTTLVTIPAVPLTSVGFVIKDGKGDAALRPITVVPAAGTIDGNTNYILSNNYQAVRVVYSGTEYNII